MHILGIESTAHTFGVGVVQRQLNEKAEIVSNQLAKFPSTQKGYIPRELVEFHSNHFKEVLEKALAEAGISIQEIDAVAYSQSPGIGHCLHFGYIISKTLSVFLGVPLIPVNHAIAHVEVGKFLCNARDPLVVYVSGGNTQILARTKVGRNHYYKVYGETLDIGIGNFLDQVGRSLNLNPPDAVGVLLNAPKGKKFIRLPYTVKGMNLAFSGLLTAINRLKEKYGTKDLCYSAQETAFSMLVEATERCLCHTRNPEVLLCGGNARNKRLQEMMGFMCAEQETRFCVAPDEYNGDNGGMIALTGLLLYACGKIPEKKEPDQKARVDSQPIPF
ncbi:tRNA (adenosine(37)-N6)-threonylcarbamoyltransferase complex transferase subunit TsaD [Candidatus Micrarchaeota archaeon]|nr:tRNA (adenosine(37)-N6)-threonylcarbamoyltransferase complex transferase subunit TsaD [Candidatus Micrarchaeota archaeon]